MSIENNKADFEKALEEIKEYMEDLEKVLNEDITTKLTQVIEEYEVHYETDIQALIDENEELKDKLNN